MATLKVALSKVGLKALFKVVIKASFKAILFALVLFGFAAVGLLPPSPFRALNNFLIAEQSVLVLRYLTVFVPIFEMLSFLSMWVGAIVVWHGVKIVLRITNVIR